MIFIKIHTCVLRQIDEGRILRNRKKASQNKLQKMKAF